MISLVVSLSVSTNSRMFYRANINEKERQVPDAIYRAFSRLKRENTELDEELMATRRSESDKHVMSTPEVRRRLQQCSFEWEEKLQSSNSKAEDSARALQEALKSRQRLVEIFTQEVR